jgi:hypothetical protein
MLGSLNFAQLKTFCGGSISLMNFLRGDLASNLKCEYTAAVLQVVLIALEGIDDVSDLHGFLLQNKYAIHNLLVFDDIDQFVLDSEGSIPSKILCPVVLSSKISNFVFKGDSYGNLSTGWEPSFEFLETEYGAETLSRCLLARFIHLVRGISENGQPFEGQPTCPTTVSQLLTRRLIFFLQHYSLMETVGYSIAGR